MRRKDAQSIEACCRVGFDSDEAQLRHGTIDAIWQLCRDNGLSINEGLQRIYAGDDAPLVRRIEELERDNQKMAAGLDEIRKEERNMVETLWAVRQVRALLVLFSTSFAWWLWPWLTHEFTWAHGRYFDWSLYCTIAGLAWCWMIAEFNEKGPGPMALKAIFMAIGIMVALEISYIAQAWLTIFLTAIVVVSNLSSFLCRLVTESEDGISTRLRNWFA